MFNLGPGQIRPTSGPDVGRICIMEIRAGVGPDGGQTWPRRTWPRRPDVHYGGPAQLRPRRILPDVGQMFIMEVRARFGSDVGRICYGDCNNHVWARSGPHLAQTWAGSVWWRSKLEPAQTWARSGPYVGPAPAQTTIARRVPDV